MCVVFVFVVAFLLNTPVNRLIVVKQSNLTVAPKNRRTEKRNRKATTTTITTTTATLLLWPLWSKVALHTFYCVLVFGVSKYRLGQPHTNGSAPMDITGLSTHHNRIYIQNLTISASQPFERDRSQSINSLSSATRNNWIFTTVFCAFARIKQREHALPAFRILFWKHRRQSIQLQIYPNHLLKCCWN